MDRWSEQTPPPPYATTEFSPVAEISHAQANLEADLTAQLQRLQRDHQFFIFLIVLIWAALLILATVIGGILFHSSI